jgi:hypothetical protein
MRDHLQVDTGKSGARHTGARSLPEAKTSAKGRLRYMIKVLIFVAVWIVVMKLVLPRLGVPT